MSTSIAIDRKAQSRYNENREKTKTKNKTENTFVFCFFFFGCLYYLVEIFIVRFKVFFVIHLLLRVQLSVEIEANTQHGKIVFGVLIGSNSSLDSLDDARSTS